MFVTRRCNAKCGTCFYADSLNDGSVELTLDEYRQISSKLGPFHSLLFSGGEPSLRHDLDQITEIFNKGNGISHAAMPTNGLLPERAFKIATGVLERCPDIRFDVNVSIDGLAETHNRIRGVPGNFKKSEETLHALIELRERQPRLRVHVETVICNSNYHEIPELIDYMWEHHRLNGHFAEVIRGTPPNPDLAPPDDARLRAIQERILANHRRYQRDRRGPNDYEYGVIDKLYEMQRGYLLGEKWPMHCVAGERMAVIEPTAEVRLCELKKIVGNLRDFDMDLHALLDAHEARELRQWIVDNNCSCTHCCFLSESLQKAGLHEPTLGRRVKRAFQSVFDR